MTWRQNATHVAAVAMGTAVLAVGIASPSPICADGPATENPENQRPVTTVDGFNVSAALLNTLSESGTLPAGKTKLTFRVTVSNPTEETHSAHGQLRLTQTAPSEPRSRVLRLPAVTWQSPLEITLQPGESRTLDIDVETDLRPGSSYQLYAAGAPVAAASGPVSVVRLLEAQAPAQNGAPLQVVPLNFGGIALVQFAVPAPQLQIQGN